MSWSYGKSVSLSLSLFLWLWGSCICVCQSHQITISQPVWSQISVPNASDEKLMKSSITLGFVGSDRFFGLMVRKLKTQISSSFLLGNSVKPARDLSVCEFRFVLNPRSTARHLTTAMHNTTHFTSFLSSTTSLCRTHTVCTYICMSKPALLWSDSTSGTSGNRCPWPSAPTPTEVVHAVLALRCACFAATLGRLG